MFLTVYGDRVQFKHDLLCFSFYLQNDADKSSGFCKKTTARCYNQLNYIFYFLFISQSNPLQKPNNNLCTTKIKLIKKNYKGGGGVCAFTRMVEAIVDHGLLLTIKRWKLFLSTCHATGSCSQSNSTPCLRKSWYKSNVEEHEQSNSLISLA